MTTPHESAVSQIQIVPSLYTNQRLFTYKHSTDGVIFKAVAMVTSNSIDIIQKLVKLINVKYINSNTTLFKAYATFHIK